MKGNKRGYSYQQLIALGRVSKSQPKNKCDVVPSNTIDTSASFSSVDSTGTITTLEEVVVDTPRDTETIDQFESRRKENLLLLDCPNKEMTVEEKMEHILKSFPESQWPILVRYWG